jgi:hypothetical protein
MSTYSAYRRVTSYGQPLDGMLRGYYQGLVPRVPWAAGYGQKSRYDRLPPAANGLRIIHPVSNMTPPLLAEDEGPPTYKELNPGAIRTIYLPHYSRHG